MGNFCIDISKNEIEVNSVFNEVRDYLLQGEWSFTTYTYNTINREVVFYNIYNIGKNFIYTDRRQPALYFPFTLRNTLIKLRRLEMIKSE